MKHLLPLLIIGLMVASCTEEPLPEPQPTEYQVRFEVECDSCMASAAVMGIGPYDSVLGYWIFDTIAYQGQGVNLTALDFGSDIDSIRIKISVNDSVVVNRDTVGNDGIVFGESYIID